MIWKCKKCQMVLDVASPLRFCPNCGEKIELSDPVRQLKWNEGEATSSVPIQDSSEPAHEEPVKPQMPLLDNFLEPPQLRLHTPAVPPSPSFSQPMTGFNPGAVPLPMEEPAIIPSPRVSYRECPFCGAPLREGSDLCEVCGNKADGQYGSSGEPFAGPWQRLLARSLDYSLEYFLIVVLLYLLAIALIFVSRQLGVALISEERLVGIMAFLFGGRLRTAFLITPFVFLLDSLEYALFGHTFGKWLFGVRVNDMNGQPLTSKAFFIRNLRVYWGGYGLNFPIVSIFTMYTQYKFVSQGLAATYDHRLGYVSVVHNESTEKTIIGVLLLCILPIITAVILSILI